MATARTRTKPAALPPFPNARPRWFLPVHGEARATHALIVDQLRAMLGRVYAGPLCTEFSVDIRRVMELFHRYQDQVVSHSGVTIACHRGCSHCCGHWPEDVYSFEAEIAADYIRRTRPRVVREVIERFTEDEEELERLDRIIDGKLMDEPHLREKISEEDRVDLLLASFYRLKRPCALLTSDGTCIIYPVRPLSCRVYLNFSDPRYCRPEHIDESDVRTYLLDLEEEAGTLLDQLHARFERFAGVTGLRALLARTLASSGLPRG